MHSTHIVGCCHKESANEKPGLHALIWTVLERVLCIRDVWDEKRRG